MRRADLITPVRGTRAPEDADLMQRCRALLLHRPEDLVFSHTTAARLYGAPLPGRHRSDEVIHVSVQAPTRAPQIKGVAGHTVRAQSVVRRGGIPITTPEQTWIDLGPFLERDELVAVGDFLLSNTGATLASLAVAVDDSAGRRGMARIRDCLPLLRSGAESPAESRLRLLLDDEGIRAPELNYSIHRRDGRFVARVDFAYPEQLLVLEYEGDHHRIERKQWHKDVRRQNSLEDLGWRVIRVTAADLAEPTELVARVRSLVQW
jgi:very-short-patch-repair endonuclease